MTFIQSPDPSALSELVIEAKTASALLMRRAIDMMPRDMQLRLAGIHATGARLALEMAMDQHASWSLCITSIGGDGVRHVIADIGASNPIAH